MLTRVLLMSGILAVAGTAAGCASALQKAAEQGDLQGVQTLLDQGAGANKDDLADAFVNAAGAGQRKMVEFFLQKGLEADTRGSCDQPVYNMGGGFTTVSMSGTTPLICAAGHGQVAIVQFLLDRGADVNAQSAFQWDALTLAAYLGHGQVARVLLDRGATNIGGALKFVRQYENRHPGVMRMLEQAEARQLGTEPPAAAVTTPPAALAPAVAAPPVPPVAPPAPAVPASDVDTPPAVRVQKNDNAYAVVIGIDTYRNKLPKADFASHDAEVMGNYLTKTMGYEEENVAVLLNERAAKTDLEKYLEHWLPKRVEKDASIFIYYSGHGAPNPKTGDAFLVPYDGDPAFVDATGYPLKRLYEQLNKLPAKQVVVMLDSCFSGGGGRSVIAKGMRPMVISVENPVVAGGRTVVLAASSGEQVSSTYDQKSHGLLTYYFLKGLQGAADKNKDGSIDLSEVFDYVRPQVERKARRDFNNEQTPQLLGNSKLLSQGIRLIDPLR